MNVNEISFGVEIECYVPFGTIAAGGYHSGVPVPGLPTGWNAQHDGSLDRRSRSRQGVEIVSPILRGVDGLQQIRTVLQQLKAWGAQVNTSCGFHVHVGFTRDIASLQKLVRLAANFETAIYAATGTKNRERGSYCRPIRETYRQYMRFDSIHHVAMQSRYHLLNVTNMIENGKGTVEFRAFSGTLDFTKIAAYVRLCVGMIERSLKMSRITGWQASTPSATSPIHRNGVGQTELTRLFYQLGWTKGRQSHAFGDLQGDNIPDLQRAKRVLMRLARKYDSQ